MSLAQCREQIAAARSAVSALGSVLWQAPSVGGPAGLAGLLGEVDDLGLACDAARVAVVGEAMDRGETSGGAAAMTVTQWVRHHAPSTRAGGAQQVVAVAQAFGKAVNAPVKEAVDAGRLPGALRCRGRLRGREAAPAARRGGGAARAGGADGHGRRARAARVPDAPPGPAREVRDRRAAAGRAGRREAVHRPVPAARHRDRRLRVPPVSLDVEGKAVLEAALGPLSAPKPVDGERDLRSSDQRRGEALVELVRRAVAAGDSVPTSPKAQIMVTMDFQDLASGLRGAGTAIGGSDTGTLLAPETVRKLACSAALIPVVLGTDGEILDQGRMHRLFTPAQTRRLWLRDGGCTYPGCSMPPHWADAHHLVHWADFGADRPGQRSPPLRAAPHHRALPPPRRPRGPRPRRHKGRVGPHARQLRRAPRPPRRAGASVTPPRTPPHAGGVRGMHWAGVGEVRLAVAPGGPRTAGPLGWLDADFRRRPRCRGVRSAGRRGHPRRRWWCAPPRGRARPSRQGSCRARRAPSRAGCRRSRASGASPPDG